MFNHVLMFHPEARHKRAWAWDSQTKLLAAYLMLHCPGSGVLTAQCQIVLRRNS